MIDVVGTLAQTITVDSGDPWWVDLAQVLSGFGALAAAVLAFLGIRQAGALQAERTRERTRDRLEDKVHALNDALEILFRLREAVRTTNTVITAAEQKRLRIAGARASSQSSHDLEIVAQFNFTGSEQERNELMGACDGAMDKVLWEIGELATRIERSF